MAKIKTLESEEIIVKGLKAQEKGELFNQKRLLPTVKHGSGAVMMWASVFLSPCEHRKGQEPI